MLTAQQMSRQFLILAAMLPALLAAACAAQQSPAAISPTPMASPTVSQPAAASPTPTAALAPAASPTPAAGCPKVDSRLSRLAVTGDPAAYATSTDLYYRDGSVRAIVELDQASADVPSGHNIVVEGRQGTLVQALVPVSELCALSNEPQVRFIRPPAPSTR